MPWRLIVFIIVLAVLLGFIGFNLGNTCDISLGFTTIQNVPVYLTVFASFMLGMISSLPFIIFRSLKKNHKKGKQGNAPELPESQTAPKPAKAKGFFGKKTADKNVNSGSYGID